MKLEYPTEFKDARGVVKSKFITDGKSLKIELRNITFEGHFWELTPIKGQEANARKYFELNEFGELNGNIDLSRKDSSNVYSLIINIPIKVVTKENNEIDAIIEFGINPHQMTFIINGEKYESECPSLEYGMDVKHTESLNINFIKCCINCKYAEYSPFGNQEYGDMICFKNCKKEWAEIGYIGLKNPDNWKKIEKRIKTQEAYYCEDFELKEKKASI